MRITFFIGSLGCGGAERVTSLLASKYADIGWYVDIALLLKNEVNEEQFRFGKNVRIVDLTVEGNSYWKKSARWIKAIRKYLKDSKPSCIISFIGRINALVLTASIGLHIPTLVSERNDPKRDGRGRFMLKYCDLIYRRADAIVFQTNYEKSCFSKALDKRSFVIPNPVEVINCDDIKENPYEVSTAGRLAPQKNQALLIDAIALVREKIPEVTCEIYGEGQLKDELESKIKKLNLEKNVHLCGNRVDINRCIAKSSVFVLTSDFEGLSNALIEAMMQGKACVSTDYPGARELIEDGYSGLIVPLENSKDILADKLCQLIFDKSLRDKLSKNAKEEAKRFSFDACIVQWVDIINGLLTTKE